MGQIWVTSDWHLNHNKEFIYKARGFETVSDMNKAIMQNHNQSVAMDDHIYVLGDCCLGQDLDSARADVSDEGASSHYSWESLHRYSN